MEESNFSLDRLQGRTYRELQQLAKSLSLPSNVKKIYLIQLIHARKFKTPAEVDSIVHRVKYERQQLLQVKKRSKRRSHLQGPEISSTSSSQSPPIIATPKRRTQPVECSPEYKPNIIRYPRPNMLRPFIKKLYSTSPVKNPSDRVLRSFNVKPKKSNNSVLRVVDSRSPENSKEATINIMCQSGYPRVNMMTKCVVNNSNIIQSNSQSVASQQSEPGVSVNKMNSYPATKRQRGISGIYPIATKETPKVSYKYVHTVGFRESDGKVTKINALIQTNNEPNRNHHSIEITVQNLINLNTGTQPNSSSMQENSLRYPNMSSVYEPNTQQGDERRDINYNLSNESQDSSVYYHKKIRAEQVRRRDSLQREGRSEDEGLPKIHDVFSTVKNVYDKDVTQPIYIQVSDESERILHYPVYAAKSNANGTTMLESLYNFKNTFVTNQPLLQIATTSTTRCVFSTPLITTPLVHTSTVSSNDTCASSCEQDSVDADPLPRINDLLDVTERELVRQNYRDDSITEDFSTAGSSLGRSNSQVLESSIPEMVEDALEIISQDGDYMERIGMDVRVQCILCSWAGPRFILEHHIRKHHSSQIYRPDKGECSVTYSLGRLARHPLWLSQLLQTHEALYVFSAKYDPPDTLMASLSVLSSDETPKMGHISIYNKATGVPHTWSGKILPLSPNLPYNTEANCFTTSVSSLHLSPNSSDLLNRESLGKSQGSSGRPELDSILIVFYIKIVD